MSEVVKVILKDKIANKLVALKLKQKHRIGRAITVLKKKYEHLANLELALFYKNNELDLNMSVQRFIEDYNYTEKKRIEIREISVTQTEPSGIQDAAGSSSFETNASFENQMPVGENLASSNVAESMGNEISFGESPLANQEISFGEPDVDTTSMGDGISLGEPVADAISMDEPISFGEPTSNSIPMDQEISFGEPTTDAVSMGEEPVADAISMGEEVSFEEPIADAISMGEEVSFGEPIADSVSMGEEISFGEPVADAVSMSEEISFGEPVADAISMGEEISFGEAIAESVREENISDTVSMDEAPISIGNNVFEDSPATKTRQDYIEMMSQGEKSFGQAVLEILTSEDGIRDIAESITSKSEQLNQSVVKTLIEGNSISETNYLSILSRKLEIDSVDLKNLTISGEVLAKIKKDVAELCCAIPVKKENNILYIALANPYHRNNLIQIRNLIKDEIEPLLSTELSIQNKINDAYKEEHKEKIIIKDGKKLSSADLSDDDCNAKTICQDKEDFFAEDEAGIVENQNKGPIWDAPTLIGHAGEEISIDSAEPHEETELGDLNGLMESTEKDEEFVSNNNFVADASSGISLSQSDGISITESSDTFSSNESNAFIDDDNTAIDESNEVTSSESSSGVSITESSEGVSIGDNASDETLQDEDSLGNDNSLENENTIGDEIPLYGGINPDELEKDPISRDGIATNSNALISKASDDDSNVETNEKTDSEMHLTQEEEYLEKSIHNEVLETNQSANIEEEAVATNFSNTESNEKIADEEVDEEIPEPVTISASETVSKPIVIPDSTQSSSIETKKKTKTLNRNLSIKHYKKVSLLKTYPISFTFSKDKIKEIIGEKTVRQIATSINVSAEDPVLKIVPQIPGCIVSASQCYVDVSGKKVQTQIWITPISKGHITDANIQLWHQNKCLKEIHLDFTIVAQSTAKFSVACAAMFPILSFIYTMFEDQIVAKSPKLLTYALEKVQNFSQHTNGIFNLGLIIGLSFLGLSFVFYFINKHKKAMPIEDSLEVIY